MGAFTVKRILSVIAMTAITSAVHAVVYKKVAEFLDRRSKSGSKNKNDDAGNVLSYSKSN